jgi:DNA-binding beta-propeller fold protein YncE
MSCASTRATPHHFRYSVSGVQSIDFGDDYNFSSSFSGVLPVGTDLGHVCQEMGDTMPTEVRLHALQDIAK